MHAHIRLLRSARRLGVVAAILAVSLLGATAATSAPAATTPEHIVDSETVYVVADATGAVRDTVVVDWLQVTGTGTFELFDPAGGLGEVESLTDGFVPVPVGDGVAATVTQEGFGDYFYRTGTTAELPLTIAVRYLLDGEEVAPDELAGLSGRLGIELTVTNHLERTETVTYDGPDGELVSSEVTYTVPLLCIPQFEIDGTRMTGITAPEGAQLAITGSTLTYAVPMMPMPEVTALIEMDARDIELAPLIVSVLPTLPSSADFSIVESLVELRDGLTGLEQLSAGHLQVVKGISDGMAAFDTSGLADAASGLAGLRTALGQMEDGAAGLAALAAGQYQYLDGVIAGIDTGAFAGIGELAGAITTMRTNVGSMESGMTDLLGLIDAQIGLVEQARSLNAAAQVNAGSLAARYPADPDALALQGTLTGQDAVLGSLLLADEAPGLPYLKAQLTASRDGLTGLRLGLEALETEAAGLVDIPGAFTALKGALVVLRDGGDPDGSGPAPYLPGLGATRDGLLGLADGLGSAADGLAGSSAEFAALAAVPQQMAELRATLDALAAGGTVRGQALPGIDTGVMALGEMAAGLGDGVRDIREGEALTEAMKAAADGYSTFLGRPEGADSQLTFLFKLDGVSK